MNWRYPAIPVLFVAASLWILTWMFVVRPRESFLGSLTILRDGIFYRWRLRGSLKYPSPETQEAAS